MLRSDIRQLAAKVNDWRLTSTNKGILTALMTVGTMVVAIKAVTVVREMTVAHVFGTGDSLDAFLIAIIPAYFAINIQIAALSAALMPVFIRTRHHDGEVAARKLAENALALVALMLVVTTGVLFLLGDDLVRLLGSGFEATKRAEALYLFQLLLPLIALQGIIKCIGTFINAAGRFAVVAAAPIATPALTIGALLVYPHAEGELLVFGVVAGAAIELLVVLIFAQRLRVPLLPRWHGLDARTRQVLWQYLPTMLGALTGGAALMIDQGMAATLEPGSVASLSYGSKVVALALTLSASPISTAVLPYLSKLAAAGDAAQLRRSLIGWIAVILPLSLPITAVLYIFSEPIIRLFLERGAFDAEDTLMVAQLQAFYALQIPFYLVGVLAARVINAMSMNQITALVGVLNVLSNIIFNLLLMRWLGLPGIALATTIVYMLSMFVNLGVVFFLLRRFEVASSGVAHAK